MAEGLNPPRDDEARAWAEYLAWANGADPAEYAATEQRAWERLERACPQLVRMEIPFAPPSNDPHACA